MQKKNIRMTILLVSILIISIVICVRVIYLASLDPDTYQILDTNEKTFQRGDIYDSNGLLLAVSDELYSVYANPKEIKDHENTINLLTQILGLSKKQVSKKIKQKKSFIWLKRQVTPKEADLIKSKKITGVGLKKEYKRFYPNKNLASHILGFCNIDNKGVEGIEKSMDTHLIPDLRKIEENSLKNQKGNDIILTIDSNIQAFSDKIIQERVKLEKAEAGSMILLDGKTGEIISMSNYPDFDPNFYKRYNQKIFRNYSIFNQFEPGSVLKVFTTAALLDNKNIDLSYSFHCDGVYEKNNYKVECTGIHGTIDYNDILKYSCNDGMLQACENIKPKDLYYYLKSFGFGMRTTVKLPGEQPGLFRKIDKWDNRSMLSIPLGQEISVNALQITKAATTFVNDGILLEPYIVKAVVDDNNTIIIKNKRKEIRRVFEKGISSKVITAMISSTEPGGTVDELEVAGIKFAAKSGTGQIYDIKTKEYSEDEFTSSLLVIFPMEQPRYILYVIFHKPKSEIKWGGIIGARTINDFLDSVSGYLNISTNNDPVINNSDIFINRRYESINNLPVKMPDLKGLNAGDIIDIFSKVNVEIKVYGRGKVISHSPDENEILEKGSVIKIYLK